MKSTAAEPAAEMSATAEVASAPKMSATAMTAAPMTATAPPSVGGRGNAKQNRGDRRRTKREYSPSHDWLPLLADATCVT